MPTKLEKAKKQVETLKNLSSQRSKEANCFLDQKVFL